VAKKKLKTEDYWAQHIIRAQQGGKDYIYALTRRKYSEDDIESTGAGEYVGLTREEKFPKITDNDPDSETFGKRVSKPNADPVGVKLVYLDEVNSTNIKKYKDMVGINGFGSTEFIWKFKQINISADKIDEFWSITQEDAYDKYVLKQVIKIETDKPNNRRRNP